LNDHGSRVRSVIRPDLRHLHVSWAIPGTRASPGKCRLSASLERLLQLVDGKTYKFRTNAFDGEGAARYRYEGDEYQNDVSLRYIDSVENQEAGGRLGAWYENDRILNWDPFIVTIGD
ncbi:hypothetical protein, partial [Streptomyces sp. NRRL F-5126]|uniref:hypothetical protein n=1 Tax=Streptomyces sp. NRRL F-5126 TaxID=1463857 RepID=UPI001F31C91B